MMSAQVVETVLKLTRASGKSIPQFVRNFSWKSHNVFDAYRYVKRKPLPGPGDPLVSKDPNFEILTFTRSEDFPLYLPGNVGLAWFDEKTTLRTSHEKFVMKQVKENDLRDEITCSIQDCPKVMRQAVYELFPYQGKFQMSDLSVVTISLKPNDKQMRQNKEVETERLTKTFIIAARAICDKLSEGGYWADFINPFSGLPYMRPFKTENDDKQLYENHEKFRCLGFQIFEIAKCKIISNEQEGNGKRFIGSLFTSAACNEKDLLRIFCR